MPTACVRWRTAPPIRKLPAIAPYRRRDDSSLTTLLVEPNQRAGLYRLALRLKALPPEMAADNRVFSLSQLTIFCGADRSQMPVCALRPTGRTGPKSGASSGPIFELSESEDAYLHSDRSRAPMGRPYSLFYGLTSVGQVTSTSLTWPSRCHVRNAVA